MTAVKIGIFNNSGRQSKIFYMLLSQDPTTTTALLWTRWGPRPLAYFTPPNSKVGSAPGFDTGAQSYPKLDAIRLGVVIGD